MIDTNVDCQIAIAIDSAMSDFEDALVVVCAEKADLSFIITNDKGFLSGADSRVPAIRPADFLSKFGG